jgi:hypothetical protein
MFFRYPLVLHQGCCKVGNKKEPFIGMNGESYSMLLRTKGLSMQDRAISQWLRLPNQALPFDGDALYAQL